MRLKDKVALVTGASRGMGEVEARMFAEEGAKVVVTDITSRGRQIVSDIKRAGGDALFLTLDISNEKSWENAVSRTVAKYGKLDVLVNNAGIGGPRNERVPSTEGWDDLMRINAKGIFLAIKYVLPEMRRGGGGSIINISSTAGLLGSDVLHGTASDLHPGYNASKGAVTIVTKSFAVKHAHENIRVNSVHPGCMPPMHDQIVDEERLRQIEENIPMKRHGLRQEVAYAVLFLASDEASYITGTEIVVDGGFTAR